VAVRRRAVRLPASAPVPVAPPQHPSGARPPAVPPELVPGHVAIVMDGNGRWANQRGLPRVRGHERGEAVLLDVVAGAIEIGVKYVSVYAFSTENWRRSPDEVRFLMGFNRDVIRRRRDEMHAWGVRVRWAGRRPRLWRSVIHELEAAEELTRHNDVLTLTMCVNYGGRAEIADAARAIAREAAAGRLDPERVDERTVARYLDEPDLPAVDLFLRSGGEQRTSNFLLWQSAYAELVFDDVLWPDVDRRVLWRAVDVFARRDRRYGGAIDAARQHAAAVPGPAPRAAPTSGPAPSTGLGWPSGPVTSKAGRPPCATSPEGPRHW
jgi:undecaprenyl diphosphate synthase